MGDYAQGTKLEPIMINITVDENLKVKQVGVGYHLRLPSGKAHQSGFSWAGWGDEVQAVVDELLRAAAEHEGVDLPTWPLPREGST